MRSCVLVVAQQIALRAKIARVLHSAGYAVELAGSRARACVLAGSAGIQAAIVVHSSELAGLEQELRETIPKTIVLGQPTNKIVRPDLPTGEEDAFFEGALNAEAILEQLSRPPQRSDGNDTAPAAVKIDDC